MKNKDLKKVILLMHLFYDFQTWTKDKRNIINLVFKYMQSGTHEYFTSNVNLHHCRYVGSYYIEQKDHARRGTLKKYRGRKLIVMCVGHVAYHDRHYLVAVIE